jgi:alkanesulfonate monooxygenase SsuD/methylene tetrahydromethanopterin reductase-like flavin-dependent oxidoreductase (luciferase family)
MKFGVFDHLDRSGAPLAQFYEDRLRLAEAYDAIGLHALHTAEHHATPLGMAPSPSVFHAAVAQRTRRLRFGPLVYTLNLYHPLRLAEEICMLDHLSGGRFQLGIGRGISPFELSYFGTDPEDGPAMYVEAFEVIRQALTSTTVNHEGPFYRYRDVPVELHPLQKPYPPLWYGIGNPESVDWCVRERTNLVSNAPASLMLQITERFRAAWQAAGHGLEELPLMGTSRHVVIAPTDAEAEAIARRAYRVWHANFMHLFWKHKAQPRFAVYNEDFDAVVRNGLIFAGSPARVRDGILRLQQASGLNYLLCRFAFGDLSYAESMRSVELFARDVLPQCSAPAKASI